MIRFININIPIPDRRTISTINTVQPVDLSFSGSSGVIVGAGVLEVISEEESIRLDDSVDSTEIVSSDISSLEISDIASEISDTDDTKEADTDIAEL